MHITLEYDPKIHSSPPCPLIYFQKWVEHIRHKTSSPTGTNQSHTKKVTKINLQVKTAQKVPAIEHGQSLHAGLEDNGSLAAFLESNLQASVLALY